MIRFDFQAIGTTWQIDIQKELSKEGESLLYKKIMDRIDEFDIAYSRFRSDSLITKMSKEAGKYKLPDDADKMIYLYKKMYEVTGGLVTPLIGQVLSDAGYDAKYSLVEKELSKPKKWDEVIYWDTPNLTLSEPALLDFGAGGKGYLVDIVSEILEAEGVKNYCVDASGDMRQRSESGEVLKVGLENPRDVSEVVGVVEIQNQSLCGSGVNKRKWGRFYHVISPETLSSPKEIEAVWVVAQSTLLSDLLTTALFFVSPETLQKHFEFEHLVLYSDFTVSKSGSFNAELFTM